MIAVNSLCMASPQSHHPEDTWENSKEQGRAAGAEDETGETIRASRRKKLYWFCSETRYPDIRVHPWSSLSLKSFRGRFFPCTAEKDFTRLLRKVS